MLRRLTIAFLFLFLGACSKSPGTGEYIPAPDLDFECSFIQSPLCGPEAAGKLVFMGLTQDLDFNCENELVFLDSSQLALRFDYHGYTFATDRGTHIFGVVTQWANAFGAKMLNIVDTDYRLCAFIDDNGNGELDFNEVLADEIITPGEPYYPITSWVQL